MSKFIEIHGTVINTEDVRRVEFLSDDIYLGVFPRGKNGEFICDYVTFGFAKIYTFDGNVTVVSIDLYIPEDEETEDEWTNRNRAYINMTMEQLREILKPIKLAGKEYE